MNIKEAKEFLQKNSHFIKGMYSFICFHWSPVTKTIEARIIYTPDYNEGTAWLDNVAEFYAKYKIPYVTYINGEMDESEGDLETGEWR